MTKNSDELKFRKAYSDRVDFKSFDEKTPELYSNSRFSLIRELATESAPKVADIKNAASVRELLSVKPQNENEGKVAQTRVALSSSVQQKNKTSSLKSFLKKNTETYYSNKVSPLTDEILSMQDVVTLTKAKENIPAEKAPVEKKDTQENIVSEENKGSSEKSTSVANDSYVLKKDPKIFHSLFRASIVSEFNGKKTDSLQELYKRLMKE
ncbi:hypothetical protein SAMN02910357_02593 [Succinivibrio dextrinosolvens]|uniref:hypothetical protein n=1 Tax=Succinivibrio dextrinosolvens TaxID=83771 RepID=UPI0008F423CA|nr:hypothetical protein [Succinivibrio dextrinosolvens]SFS91909.1 hypothetical protein SAMN02910357_02593 [Succinivibrio dextrinosolvens]